MGGHKNTCLKNDQEHSKEITYVNTIYSTYLGFADIGEPLSHLMEVCPPIKKILSPPIKTKEGKKSGKVS